MRACIGDVYDGDDVNVAMGTLNGTAGMVLVWRFVFVCSYGSWLLLSVRMLPSCVSLLLWCHNLNHLARGAIQHGPVSRTPLVDLSHPRPEIRCSWNDLFVCSSEDLHSAPSLEQSVLFVCTSAASIASGMC
jgi:hypothetical protein